MNKEDESLEQLITLVSAIFNMISCIMSILATTTSGWQIDGFLNKTGLFQTCYKDSCSGVEDKHYISISFAIIGQCVIICGIVSSFTNAFVYRHRLGLVLITICCFMATSLLWITVMTTNAYLYMNGGSAIIFNASIAFSLFAAFTASYGLGVSFATNISHFNSRLPMIPIQYNSMMMPMELYRHRPT